MCTLKMHMSVLLLYLLLRVIVDFRIFIQIIVLVTLCDISNHYRRTIGGQEQERTVEDFERYRTMAPRFLPRSGKRQHQVLLKRILVQVVEYALA